MTVVSVRFTGEDIMRLRALVNTAIAPARITGVMKVESRDEWAFLGRWGTFTFDVVLAGHLVRDARMRGGIEQLAHLVIALSNEAVESAIETMVYDSVSLNMRAYDERLRDLEARELELSALLQQIVDRQLSAWYRRAWRALVATLHGLRHALVRPSNHIAGLRRR